MQAERHSVGTAHQRHSKPTRDLVAVGTVLYITLPFLVAASFSASILAFSVMAWQKVQVRHKTVGKAKYKEYSTQQLLQPANLPIQLLARLLS